MLLSRDAHLPYLTISHIAPAANRTLYSKGDSAT